jgi:amino acid transporter
MIDYPTRTLKLSAVVSMAEEVRNPSVQVPQAIVYSVPIGSISGLAFLLPIVSTLPDVETLLAGLWPPVLRCQFA